MNVIPAANDLSSTASGRVRELVSQADRDSVPPQHHDLVADDIPFEDFISCTFSTILFHQ